MKLSLTNNGYEVRIYINGLLHVSFVQKEYLGLYSYRNGTKWYGIDIYLGSQIIELEYESRDTWEQVLKLFDTHMRT